MTRRFSRPLGLVLLAVLLALVATVLALRDGIAARSGKDTAATWVCAMHSSVRQPGPGRCPECGMELISARLEARTAARDAPRSIVIDDRRQQLIGVRTARVTRGSLTRPIRAAGAVEYDENRLVDVNLKVEGWIRDVHGRYVGQRVRRGEPLFSVYSPELDAVVSNLLTALRSREQTGGRPADPSYADRVVDAPRQRLERWDVSDIELRQIEQSGQVPAAVVFRSPIEGVIIEKAVIKGSHVQPGQTLYKIADLSVVWIEVDFSESDLKLLREGLRTEISLDAYPGEVFYGRILNVQPFVNEETRTIAARIELANPRRRLKAGMWVNVKVPAALGEGLIVPADAVVDSGNRQIVFVTQGGGFFEPRAVTVGGRANERLLITDGLREDEEIAVRATFFLDSESQIGAAVQNYEAAAEQPVRHTSREYDLTMEVEPDPPRTGEHLLRVRVAHIDSGPVTDAAVLVRLYMPPMPTMNMPAMASEVRLVHVGDGVYRGPATIQMRGRWDVSITAVRNGHLIASTRTTLIAR